MSKSSPSNKQPDLIRALRSIRWPLAGTAGLVFALTRLAEIVLVGPDTEPLLSRLLDALFWGCLAAIAIYAVLSWAVRQEQRFRTAESLMLGELRQSNATLELLYELNQRVASSATLDDVLDYAITLPNRLLGASIAALALRDETGLPLTIRTVGQDDEVLAATRATFGLLPEPPDLTGPCVILGRNNEPPGIAAVVILPLAERDAAPIGWIEAYLDAAVRLNGRALDQQLPGELENLLLTVGGELAEAVQNSRRRAREIASVAALEQAITAERTRIARDLHDGIAQSLAFMRMRVDLWQDWLEQDPRRLYAEFADLKTNLRRQIEELRQAIFALRPIELSQLGFAGALRRFVGEFAEQQEWRLDLDLSRLPTDLPHVLELAAFRFVQEALNNAAKHAQAQRVAVALREIDAGLQIIVRDDGVGFDPVAQADSPGARLGLRQMRERAAALDGRVTILSQPGEGAEIRVWLPLIYVREEKP